MEINRTAWIIFETLKQWLAFNRRVREIWLNKQYAEWQAIDISKASNINCKTYPRRWLTSKRIPLDTSKDETPITNVFDLWRIVGSAAGFQRYLYVYKCPLVDKNWTVLLTFQTQFSSFTLILTLQGAGTNRHGSDLVENINIKEC